MFFSSPVNQVKSLLCTLLLLPAVAFADVNPCVALFTSPPTLDFDEDVFIPPSPPSASLPAFTCKAQGQGKNSRCFEGTSEPRDPEWPTATFAPGDYHFSSGEIGTHTRISISGEGTARFYFDTLDINNAAVFNIDSANPGKLIIYVADELEMEAHASINGLVFTGEEIDGQQNHSSITGGIASAGDSMSLGHFTFNSDAILAADFGEIQCRGGSGPDTGFHLQYGDSPKAAGRVEFSIPFEAGVTPLVFLMPTIDSHSPTADRPASLRLTHIDNRGFNYQQIYAPRRFGQTSKVPMPQVHWIAITPGEHRLTGGPSFFAGVEEGEEALGLTSDAWEDIDMSQDYDVFLTQRQVDNVNCWLTTLARPEGRDEFEVALDVSEVKGTKRRKLVCKPGNKNEFDDVPIAYLAVKSGSGVMSLNGKQVEYEFGKGVTHARQGIQSLSTQCQHMTTFPRKFTQAPVLVAGKQSRHGGDGGWLRRCQLTASDVSMVNDEDQYQDTDRSHVSEEFGYIAMQSVDDQESPLHHLQLEYSGNPLTCAPLNVTVKACDNADCSQLYPDPILVNLTTDKGDWSQPSINITGSGQVSLSQFVVDSVTIGATTPTVSALAPTLCSNGNETSEAACTMGFAESGFIIDDSNSYSGKPADIQIKAVRAGTEALECIPTFGGETKRVNLSRIHKQPVAPASNLPLTINDEVVGTVPTAHELSFDSQGVATVSWRYADAGELQLKASYIGSDEDDGLVMNSVNGTLRSVPYGLCVAPVNSAANYQLTTDKAFMTSGSDFPVRISAHSWQANSTNICSNDITPSFEAASVELSSQFAVDAIPAAEQGRSWSDGILSPAAYSHTIAKLNGGNSVELDVKQSEVGVFRLKAALPAGQFYLGAGLPISSVPSAPLGRFVPAWYQVGDVTLNPACGAFGGGLTAPFTYMDQAMPLTMSLTAQNVQGLRTFNYQGWLAKAGISLVAENADNGLSLSNRMSALPVAAWQTGRAQWDAEPVQFLRTAPPAVDGPYPLLDIGIDVLDNDAGLGVVKDPDMNPDIAGPGAGMTAKKLNTLALRHGRVSLNNTYGLETAVLSMPLRVEQWTANGWQLNPDDVCTSVGASGSDIVSGLSHQSDNFALGYRFDPALAAGQSIVRSGNGSVENGRFQLGWQSQSSAGQQYRGKVTAPVVVAPWLQWYWNWDGDAADELANPRSSAFFGRYRGNDKVIFFREIQ